MLTASLEAFAVSTGIVALAEMGDKSQLLVLALATRFGKPVPIILGIIAATVLNHTAAGVLGAWLATAVSPKALRALLCVSFIGIAVWVLLPGKPPAAAPVLPRAGVFITTLCGFFLLEMGDKTQFATIALAARYGALLPVVAGSTLGIVLADAPIVILSAATARHFRPKPVRAIAAAVFLGIGIVGLLDVLH
jgi:Ca2+/H+ antiporter, TMEM165/GDT1 family